MVQLPPQDTYLAADRRSPLSLRGIQPKGRLSEYKTELLNVLNVLGRLIDLEPRQKDLLDKVCAGPLIDRNTLAKSGTFHIPKGYVVVTDESR